MSALIIRLPSAATIKVKQPPMATRHRLARGLPRLVPAPAPVAEANRYRDTQQSTTLAVIMAILTALPEDIVDRTHGAAELLAAASSSAFTLDAVDIVKQAQLLRRACIDLKSAEMN